MKRVPSITMADARWVQRELKHACKAYGLPGLAPYIQVEFPARFRGQWFRSIGLATAGPRRLYVGNRTLPQPVVAACPHPFRIRIHRGWWQQENRHRRRYILIHELTHILVTLAGGETAHHGKMFRDTQKRLVRRCGFKEVNE